MCSILSKSLKEYRDGPNNMGRMGSIRRGVGFNDINGYDEITLVSISFCNQSMYMYTLAILNNFVHFEYEMDFGTRLLMYEHEIFILNI